VRVCVGVFLCINVLLPRWQYSFSHEIQTFVEGFAWFFF
jgi:hypothetical protein